MAVRIENVFSVRIIHPFKIQVSAAVFYVVTISKIIFQRISAVVEQILVGM